MHPDTLKRLSLEAGRKVEMVTPYGRANFVIHPEDSLPPSVVHVEHAWWFPEKPGPDHGWRESCANLLFGQDCFDPDSGAEPLKSASCRIEP
jgi:anaerobic selenocysteine-containing dehydrogenase